LSQGISRVVLRVRCRIRATNCGCRQSAPGRCLYFLKEVELSLLKARELDKALQAAPLREAPLTHEIALETFGLKFPHRDPADRFLVATARVLGLTLVTADERLINSHQVVSSSKFISHRTGVRAQKFPPNPPRTYSDSHAVGYSAVVASDEAACFRVCLKIRSSAPLEDFRHFSWSRTSIPTMPTSF
jgi:predicted nucleic acid-binding protein